MNISFKLCLFTTFYNASCKSFFFRKIIYKKDKSPSANTKGFGMVWLPYWTRLELLRGDTGIDNT